jgi:hypothetical protein
VGQPQTFRSPTAVVVWIVWLLFAVGNWIDLAVQGRDHTSVVAAAILLMATGAAYVTAQRPRIIADDAGLTVRNPLRDHRIGWTGVAEVDLVDLLRVHCAWRGAAPADQEHTKVISAWAVHYSRRRQLAAEARTRRAARPSGRRSSLGFPSAGRDLSYGARVGGSVPGRDAATAEAEAEQIVRLLRDRATTAQAEAVWAAGTGQADAGQAGAGQAGTGQAAGAEAAGETVLAAETGPASAASGTTAVAAAGWTEPLTSTWSGRAIAALVIPALILLVVCLL